MFERFGVGDRDSTAHGPLAPVSSNVQKDVYSRSEAFVSGHRLLPGRRLKAHVGVPRWPGRRVREHPCTCHGGLAPTVVAHAGSASSSQPSQQDHPPLRKFEAESLFDCANSIPSRKLAAHLQIAERDFSRRVEFDPIASKGPCVGTNASSTTRFGEATLDSYGLQESRFCSARKTASKSDRGCTGTESRRQGSSETSG